MKKCMMLLLLISHSVGAFPSFASVIKKLGMKSEAIAIQTVSSDSSSGQEESQEEEEPFDREELKQEIKEGRLALYNQFNNKEITIQQLRTGLLFLYNEGAMVFSERELKELLPEITLKYNPEAIPASASHNSDQV